MKITHDDITFWELFFNELAIALQASIKVFFEQFCHHQVKQGMLSELKHRHRKKTNLEGENLTIT